MKQQSTTYSNSETGNGRQGPEFAVPERLRIVSGNIGMLSPLIDGMKAVRQPVSMGHNYDNPAYRLALDKLTQRAIVPVTRPILHLVEDKPVVQNILKDEIIIDQRQFEILAKKEAEVVSVNTAIPEQPMQREVAPVQFNSREAKLEALRTEIHGVSVPIKEAYADLTKTT